MSRCLYLVLSCLLLFPLLSCAQTGANPPEGLVSDPEEPWQAKTPRDLFDALKWVMLNERFDVLYDLVLSRYNRERNERLWEKEKGALLAGLLPGGTLTPEQKSLLKLYGVSSAEELKPLDGRGVYIHEMAAAARREQTKGWWTITFVRARLTPDRHSGSLTLQDHRKEELTLRIVFEDGGWRWRTKKPEQPEQKDE